MIRLFRRRRSAPTYRHLPTVDALRVLLYGVPWPPRGQVVCRDFDPEAHDKPGPCPLCGAQV